jgi:hypothetical protein
MANMSGTGGVDKRKATSNRRKKDETENKKLKGKVRNQTLNSENCELDTIFDVDYSVVDRVEDVEDGDMTFDSVGTYYMEKNRGRVAAAGECRIGSGKKNG